MVALGQSCQAWMHHQLRKNRPRADIGPLSTEVWTVNRGIRLFAADMAFILDELDSEIQRDKSYGDAIISYEKPIITTRCSPLVHTSQRYPAAEILDCIREWAPIGDPYWHNSIPMIVAYAMLIGVKSMVIWGADYTLPGGRTIEDDRANLEYWIGFARARGMKVGVPMESTLLNSLKHQGELHVYGLLDQGEAQAWLEGR